MSTQGPTSEPLRLMVSAGEPSGDAIGAALVGALRAGGEQWEVRGIVGPALEAAGALPVVRASALGAMGLVEVVAILPAVIGALWRCRRLIADWRPDALVLIDYPGLNLLLGWMAARRGVPVIYLVPPKVWAWGRWRLGVMRRVVSRVLAIFPFEEAVFSGAGIPTTFVGHPIADRAPAPTAPAGLEVALLPGSRLQEVRRLLPVMLEAAGLFLARHPGARFTLPVGDPSLRGVVAAGVGRARVPVEIVSGGGMDALARARVALVASGTATLEAAAVGTPAVVIYRLAEPTWQLARRLVRGVRHVSLPNILAGREVFPEHLQRLDAAELAAELDALAKEGPRRDRILADLAEVRAHIGPPGVAARAAAEVRAAVAEARAEGSIPGERAAGEGGQARRPAGGEPRGLDPVEEGISPPGDRSLLARLAAEFAPHRGSLLLALLASLGVSASEGARIFLIKDVLDSLLAAGDRASLIWLPLAIALVTAAGGMLQAARGWLARKPTLEVMRDLRLRLFRHLQALPLTSLQRHRAGDLASRLTHDVAAVNQGQTVLITLLQQPLTLAALLATALWHEPTLTVLSLTAVPLIGVPVVWLSQSLRVRAREGQGAHGILQARLAEDLSGARVVRATGAEAEEEARFVAENDAVLRAQLHGLAARLVASPLVAVVAAVGAAAALWVGADRVIAGVSTPGSLVAFLLALGLIYAPIKGLTQVPLLLAECRAGLERVYALLDEPAPSDPAGGIPLDAPTATLRWEGVWADRGEGPVLRGIHLEVGPGEILAITGPSGAGKSTLIDLVPRLIEPSRGRIAVNGADVRALDLASLRRHVALVTQDTFLFHDTIAANIAFGVDATPAQLRAAAEAAGAAGFIDALPAGYDTLLGDRGARLSGGEAQRIALARAFLREAPIVLLDEATAHLDPDTERRLMETVRGWRDRAVVVVSHRPSTTAWADRVAVLEGGALISVSSAASGVEVA